MSDLRSKIESCLRPEQILDRDIDRIAYASDASVYRLVPQAVVRPQTIADVQGLFRVSRALRIPVTFRTAGTSLSGQAITDGLLADVAYYWRSVEPLDHGRRVRVQPGAIGGRVNRVLMPYGARLGPDPASIDACMMGGILSNNASGMCCGVAQNSYHTLESLTFVLPSGTVVDTAAPDAGERLLAEEPQLAAGLIALRDRVRGTPALASRIRDKYRTKNTTGYSLNAFIDFDRPIDILAHLLVGAEGTLAFIADAVLRTVPDLPVKYTGLLLFPAIAEACSAIAPLAAAGAAALEVMDRAALRSVEDVAGVPAALTSLPPGAAGLLVEFQEPEGTSVESIVTRADAGARALPLIEAARFTFDPIEQALLWRVRKGMFPSVGAVRQRGTSVIIEDVAFPVPSLASAVQDLQALFVKHGYADAIIFGHAKDGNLHFVLSQSFAGAVAIRQYEGFMRDVVELVVGRHDGALKAEHGTGRNMAPFVETEWGPEAYAVMKELKALVDPDGLLNPGVIINGDPRAHVSDLKSLPEVETEVDRCIECGFCEPHCPSRDLTLSPRQRIVVRREMARNPGAAPSLSRAFGYDALDTCATDGLCAVACPVRIDTGQLTKRLRAASHSTLSRRAAVWTARHFAATAFTVRQALAMRGLAPRRMAPLPAPAPSLPETEGADARAIYFPSCLTRTMGTIPGEVNARDTAAAFVAVAERAGRPLRIPAGVERCCCGMPYSSKGFVDAHAFAVNSTIELLWHASREGTLPVVVDTSPCTFGLRGRDALSDVNRARAERMRIVDAIEYFAADVVPRLTVRRRHSRVTLHPVCATIKMGIVAQLVSIAERCSEDVFVPPSSGCCGFAGDRGWLVPELTASATVAEASEVRHTRADGWYSSGRTCEIGLARATGRIYRSWIHLLDWATDDR